MVLQDLMEASETTAHNDIVNMVHHGFPIPPAIPQYDQYVYQLIIEVLQSEEFLASFHGLTFFKTSLGLGNIWCLFLLAIFRLEAASLHLRPHPTSDWPRRCTSCRWRKKTWKNSTSRWIIVNWQPSTVGPDHPYQRKTPPFAIPWRLSLHYCPAVCLGLIKLATKPPLFADLQALNHLGFFLSPVTSCHINRVKTSPPKEGHEIQIPWQSRSSRAWWRHAYAALEMPLPRRNRIFKGSTEDKESNFICI